MKNLAVYCGIILGFFSAPLFAGKSSQWENKIIKSLNLLQKVQAGVLKPVCSEENSQFLNKKGDELYGPYFDVTCEEAEISENSCIGADIDRSTKDFYHLMHVFKTKCKLCDIEVSIVGAVVLTEGSTDLDAGSGPQFLGGYIHTAVGVKSFKNVLKACTKKYGEDYSDFNPEEDRHKDLLYVGWEKIIKGSIGGGTRVFVKNTAETRAKLYNRDFCPSFELDAEESMSTIDKKIQKVLNQDTIKKAEVESVIREGSYFDEAEDFTWDEQGLKKTLVYSQDRMADVVKKYPEFKSKSSDQSEDTLYTHFIFGKEAPSKEFLEKKLSAIIKGEKSFRANEEKIINIDQCFIESTKKPWILRVASQKDVSKINEYTLDCNVFGEVILKER